MELEKQTMQKMAACFGRQTCCCCGRPAERLRHNRFYCISHLPCGRADRWETFTQNLQVPLWPQGADVRDHLAACLLKWVAVGSPVQVFLI